MARKSAAAPVAPTIKVRATLLGYAGDRRRRPGDVFRVPEKHFSARWMERVSDDTPETSMSPADWARRQQAQVNVPKINPIGHSIIKDDDEDDAPAGGATGDRDVLS